MKALISTLLLFTAVFLGKSQETEENRFQQSENAATGTANTGSAIGGVGGEQEAGPGNPPGDEEIPIDDYLPILAITASAIMVYHYKIKNHKMVK